MTLLANLVRLMLACIVLTRLHFNIKLSNILYLLFFYLGTDCRNLGLHTVSNSKPIFPISIIRNALNYFYSIFMFFYFACDEQGRECEFMGRCSINTNGQGPR